ncbi:MAG: sugar phosphate nucleotidyltransferase, partial [Bacteroidales bacterium]|nr:sugar phosphate nucleotidyltransferase [Bacteroidales bacterium]
MGMEAMILAAGKGSRLRPLTDNRPKALVEIAGQTLLDRNIRKMISFGIKHIVINTHYLGEQIHDYVKQKNYNADIFFSEETECLLDTGGGLLAAEKYFTKTAPILL